MPVTSYEPHHCDSGTPGNAEVPSRQTAETIASDGRAKMSRLVNDLLLAKAERADFLNPKLEELDWLTEELYLKARALESRDWRESKGLSPVWSIVSV